MVYKKEKSGDPDFDDKVPADQHGGRIVKAGDGTPVAILTESVGPVTPDGAHYNLGGPKAEDLDTRPAPGEVAEEKAEVQTYTADVLPGEQISEDEAAKEQAEGGTTTLGQSGDVAAAEQAEAARPAPAKKASASKTTDAK